MIVKICDIEIDNENKDDVFSFLLNMNVNKNKSGYFVRECNFKKYFDKLYNEFTDIVWNENLPFKELLWHFLQNDIELNMGKCKKCGKRCNFKRFTTGYSKYCSLNCVHNDYDLRNKMKDSISKRSESYKNSIVEKTKKTKLENHGDKNYNNREKCKNTCLEKYGVDNPSKSNIVKDKIKDSFLKKYGVENIFQSEYIKECIKKINIQKYGVEHPMYNEYIKTKQRESMLNHYDGLWNSQTSEWIDLCHKTKLENYGDKNYNNREKCKNTCLEKYGVENVSQMSGIQSKRRKRIQYKGLTFDSTWEVEVYMYCEDNNIYCVYQPEKKFEYYYDGKQHFYHPDFYINGRYYEVKGDHFFDGDKMICPYDRNEYNDGLCEAKHQCMIKNDIIILRKNNLFDIR